MTFQFANSVINGLPHEQPPAAATFASPPAEFPS
jgi:hypothetical protein